MAYQTVKVRRETLELFKEACARNGEKVNTVLREAMQNYIIKTDLQRDPEELREGVPYHYILSPDKKREILQQLENKKASE